MVCCMFATTKGSTVSCAKDAKNENNVVPKVKEIKQLGKNQVEVSFDKETDITKTTKPENYWVQCLSDTKPSGIATVGKDEKICEKNALTSNQLEITQKDTSNQVYILTFKEDIEPKIQYKFIICHITSPGASDYTGENGSFELMGK